MNTKIISLIIAGLFTASSAMAAEGQTEVSVSGQMDNSSVDGGADTTVTVVTASLGQYISPLLVVRGNVLLASTEGSGSTTTLTGVGAGIKFYVAEGAKSAWVPFALANINFVSLESGTFNESGYGASGGVGVSNFITEDVSFDITGEAYSNTFADSTQDGTRILFGLTARY